MKRVLIVEDDPDLGNLLKQYLELNEFYADRVHNGEEARKILSTNQYDILIVDVMMPKEDGFSLGRYIRSVYPDQPFLFVTAKNTQPDIIEGLTLGADDYITKPFDADELILRINNILKRAGHGASDKSLSIGAYRFEPDNLLLQSPSSAKTLTEKEAALLLFLVKHKNQLVYRKNILQYLWGDADFFNGRSMDVFVSRLRKLLSEDPAIQIESVRGVGFRLTVK